MQQQDTHFSRMTYDQMSNDKKEIISFSNGDLEEPS